METLPSLYKSTKTGAVQVCNISYEDDIFYVEFGQLNGKMQVRPTLCFYTNKGKSNERDPIAQAEFEAKAKWTIKVKAGYSESIEAPRTVKHCQKVKVYQDQLKNVQDEVYTSEKLDGVNGTYRLEDNRVNLYSRGGEPYPEIPHLTDDIFDIFFEYDLDELNLELYIKDTPLQHIQSAVKKPKELSRRIEARIFEVPNVDGDYTAHLAKMETIDTDDMKSVSIIPVRIARSLEEIEEHYEDAMANGAEGLIIRNGDGIYIHNQRSSDVFKYKKAQDAEFQISDCTIDKNGHPVFLCHTENGKPFKVKPKGTATERLAILDNLDDYLDHWYKIEFETYSESGIPLKPVGICLRNCDASGDPLE